MKKPSSVLDELMFIDEKYFTSYHCDINNWTADFDEFCKEFDLSGVRLTDKFIGLIDEVDNTFNNGKKADSNARDRAKLRESYEKNGIDPSQPPICVVKQTEPVNGGTRLDDDVLPKLGVKAYCFWEVEFDSELDRIDFENKVNDPETKFYARQNAPSDVEIGVTSYASRYRELTGNKISEEELRNKIDDYGGNSLTKVERNQVYKSIMAKSAAGKIDVEPARYKTWTNQTFKTWMNSDDFIDPRKADCIKDPSKYFIQNAKNGARWRQHIDETYRCAVDNKPMNQIVLTPPPEIDGEEMEERKDFYNDREKLYLKLDTIFEYRFKNGHYPAQHPSAELLFAPSTHAETKMGKLIDWPDEVLAALAQKEVERQKTQTDS